jgi:hypothetical protein
MTTTTASVTVHADRLDISDIEKWCDQDAGRCSWKLGGEQFAPVTVYICDELDRIAARLHALANLERLARARSALVTAAHNVASQPREREVACRGCQEQTWAQSAVCERCTTEQVIADTLGLRVAL